ncbi:Uncharacterized protein TCM_039609 [Theobroma cacao]|uniref:Uncharacterized protein n=1 Tax=Theobroma cacao TaxID=3641 RepID=A0A061GYA1_THECC|nr:Uncharacterized protein TCM_039609 [Theobroma cacao]
MESNKERREKGEAEQVRDKRTKEDAAASFESTTKTTGMDPMAKVVINETIVSDAAADGAQNPDDVLALSRSLHKIDSSLQ